MNVNKKSSGRWILCRSKSIPGKYYYFNSLTGEAVWSCNGTKSKFVKRGYNRERVPDKIHNYPEPGSAHGQNANTSSIFNPRNNFRSSPFGHAKFPNYISNVEPRHPNIIRRPIQKRTFMTNTSEERTSALDKVPFFQTRAMSLSKGFGQTRNMDTDLTFDANTNNVPAKKFKSSTPIKNCWSNKGKFNLNTSVYETTHEKSSELQYKRKLDKPNLIIGESKLKRLKTLSESNYMDGPLSKQTQNQASSVLESTPKKKVSFNLTDISDDYSSIQDDENYRNKEIAKWPTPNQTLKKLGPKGFNKGWYISVDEDVLLEEYDIIKDYICADILCKLLIPVSMLKYIEWLGMGEHAGRSRVLDARRLYRRLATSEQVQTVETDAGMSLMEDVLKCCLDIMAKDLHVVLITKNFELERIAKYYEINVYNWNDIKNGVTIPVKHKVKNNDNLFLQKVNDFDPFILKKINPGNSIEMTAFNYNKVDGINKYNIENKFDSIQNYDNNLIDVCIGIEKLYINDKKFNDIKRIIKNSVMDNTNTTSKTDIHKIEPIFDYITIQNEHKNDSVTSKFSKAISCENEMLFNKGQQKHTPKLTFENISRKPNCLSSFNPKQNVDEKLTNNIEKPDISRSADQEMNLKKYNCSMTSIYNSVEERLESFDVKDKIIGDNIIIRKEELVCCYMQIMEKFIHIVLQKSPSTKNQVPYFFRDGLLYLNEIYFYTKDIRMIVEKLLDLCDFSPKKGTIKKDIKPSEFMKVLGCGLLLVEAFKNILSEDLSEIEDLLTKLLESVENSELYEDPQLMDTPLGRSEDDISMFRRNFIKRRSDIVEYLKKHFVEWKDYVDVESEAAENEEINEHIKIFRTFGKHLNTFKIDNKKRISFENPNKDCIETNKNEEVINEDTNKQIDIPVLHENTFADGNDNGPKIITNEKLKDEFEEKVKERVPLDLDALDYSEISLSLSSIEEVPKNLNETQVDESGTLNDSPNINTDLTQTNDTLLINDEAHNYDVKKDTIVLLNNTKKSLEIQACIMIKSFLYELCDSFIAIHTFMKQSADEFQNGITDEKKNDVLDKAKQFYTFVINTIQELNEIAEKESLKTMYKSVVAKAGSVYAGDQSLTKYSHTLTICLQQAHVLKSCLKTMLCLDDVSE